MLIGKFVQAKQNIVTGEISHNYATYRRHKNFFEENSIQRQFI